MKTKMKTILALALSFSSFLVSNPAFAKSTNGLFDYSVKCQKLMTDLRQVDDRSIVALTQNLENIDGELGTLDMQLRVAKSKKTSAAFRRQIFNAAQSTQQGIQYSMREIFSLRPALAKRIHQDCDLANVVELGTN